MSSGIGMSVRRAVMCAALALVSMVCGCATEEVAQQRQLPPVPSSPWGGNYSYRYEPPAKSPAASVSATIVVVNPFYKESESILADPTYSRVGKGFSASMGVDMDKVVIAKGMTVKGPYSALDEITYSDKKGSHLTLAPKLFITTRTKYIGDPRTVTYRNDMGQEELRQDRDFEMNIGGWVAFVMQEPLSAEKMWIKKLELEDTTIRGIESYAVIPQYSTYRTGCFDEFEHSYVSGYTLGKLMYDGKVDAVADVLKTLYPTIMEKCWTYIDTEEVLSFKEKVKEIRELKRY